MSHDVIVVGGGLIGAAAALGAAREGFSVLLVEKHRPLLRTGVFAMDVRNVTLSPASRDLLEGLGVWEALAPTPFRRMHVWEDQGTQAIDFDAGEVDRCELGWIVENSPTVCELFTALEQETNVEIVFGADLQQIDTLANRVVLLTDQGAHEAKLLIGVDGAGSNVRTLVGAVITTYPTGQSALATLVRVACGHNGVAYQRFLLDGPLALLPSRDQRIVSVVWSQSEAEANRRKALTDDAFCVEISAAAEQVLGEVEAVDERFVFPIQQQLVSRFDPTPRVLLIGDAARVLHPLAGLGANVGFEDVRDLLGRLRVMPSGQDPGAAGLWRGFARRRRARARVMLGLMATLRGVYAQDDPLLQWLRNTGVKLTGQLPAVKQQLIREALGLGPLAARW